MKASLAFLAGIAVAAAIGAADAKARYATDSFVRMLEMRLGSAARLSIGPGTTIVSVDCGCTVKYLGTRRDGRHYHIDIDRLD